MIGWLPGEINVVDVRDVALAHITAVEKGDIGERYLIGGHNYTVKEALKIAANVAGVKEARFEIPMWAIESVVSLGDFLPFLPVPANHLRTLEYWQGYNCEKANQGFELTPRFSAIRFGMRWSGSERWDIYKFPTVVIIQTGLPICWQPRFCIYQLINTS